MEAVLTKQPYFPAEDWGHISDECKNLLCGLLDKDPKRRLTAKQAMEHSWFCGDHLHYNSVVEEGEDA